MLKRPLAGISAVFFLTMGLNSVHAADLIEAASSASTFKTFLAAAKSAGLTETLKTSGPYTIFTPSDQAFAKLSNETRDNLMKDKARLEKVLKYHMVPGKILVADVKPGPTSTVEGSTVKLTSDNGIVTINGASVIQSDTEADNGVIHEIDTVLLPK